MVAEFYGVDERTIKRYVQDHGDELRAVGTKKSPSRLSASQRRWQDGENLNEEDLIPVVNNLLKIRYFQEAIYYLWIILYVAVVLPSLTMTT